MTQTLFKQEEKTIGEFTYKVTQLDAMTGIDVIARITTKFGSALKEDGDGGWQAAGAVLEKLTAEEIKYYVNLFAGRTFVVCPDGREPVLKDVLATHFAGRYGDMIEWLRFCFETNFKSFFDFVRARFAEGLALMGSMSSSPSTSAASVPSSGAS